MNDFYSKQSDDCDSPLRDSFNVYLNDKHAASDLILSMGHCEAQNALHELLWTAPHAVAKVLALLYPYNAEQADRVERVIQGTLF